jgi:hypothetical protein
MFIYAIWDEICQELSKLKTIRADEILNQKSDDSWIVIKHDVETNVSKSLSLAKIEAKYSIKATYYVQADLLKDNYKTLQEIQKLGHEVTYHYDVLDANSGDFDLATEEFNKNINLFNSFGFKIKTICPHGNPLINRDGWSSNKDFFRDRSVADRFYDILDIVVGLPSRVGEYIYISDTGYGWKQIVNIANNDIKSSGDIDLGDYRNLLIFIKKEERVVLSTHPHRWEQSYAKALFNLYRFKILRATARRLSSISFFKKIMSKFYFLAKKV